MSAVPEHVGLHRNRKIIRHFKFERIRMKFQSSIDRNGCVSDLFACDTLYEHDPITIYKPSIRLFNLFIFHIAHFMFHIRKHHFDCSAIF